MATCAAAPTKNQRNCAPEVAGPASRRKQLLRPPNSWAWVCLGVQLTSLWKGRGCGTSFSSCCLSSVLIVALPVSWNQELHFSCRCWVNARLQRLLRSRFPCKRGKPFAGSLDPVFHRCCRGRSKFNVRPTKQGLLLRRRSVRSLLQGAYHSRCKHESPLGEERQAQVPGDGSTRTV